ncbi:hypothetical protein RRG08_034616 [Elysia crispata]|uniref:Uncharacterized protein n=1 Tax=Elysia crispata TaxID=231223 RepID=A0AAE1B346_9GAST|nr:hypothetical protein RRG08_034616 [Elysia crispata]
MVDQCNSRRSCHSQNVLNTLPPSDAALDPQKATSSRPCFIGGRTTLNSTAHYDGENLKCVSYNISSTVFNVRFESYGSIL